MIKKKKIITVAVVIVFIALLLIVNFVFHNVFSDNYTNEPFFSGNTSSNLHNKGLVCEYNGTVYYSNPYDQNALYAYNASNNSNKKLAEGSVKYINTDGHYIYYVKEPANTMESSDENLAFLSGGLKGVYRCDMHGNNTKVLTDNTSGVLHLIGNTLFYQRYDTDKGLHLYALNLNGTNEKKIEQDALNPAGYADGKIYCTGFSNALNVRVVDTETMNISNISDIKGYMCIPDGEYLYYMDLDRDYALSRYQIATGNIEHLTEKRLDTYHICGDTIFYQVSDEQSPGLYCMNKDTLDSQLIKEGVFCNLNADSSYLYFNDFYNTVPIYRVPVSGSSEVTEFTIAEDIDQN